MSLYLVDSISLHSFSFVSLFVIAIYIRQLRASAYKLNFFFSYYIIVALDNVSAFIKRIEMKLR
jgi:hypothetical protein